MILITGVNRFCAIMFPLSYTRIWTNRNTLIVCIILFLVTVIYCYVILFKFTGDDEKFYHYTTFASVYFFYLLSSMISLILSIICFLKPKSVTNNAQQQAQRKLLVINLYLIMFYSFDGLHSAYGQLKTLRNYHLRYWDNRRMNSLIN